jgi:hypothetical protein
MSKDRGRWSARKIWMIVLGLPLLLHGINALNTWYLSWQAERSFAAAVAVLPPAQDAVFRMPSVNGLCYVPLERCLETVLDPKFEPKAIWPVEHMHCQNPDSPFCPKLLEAERGQDQPGGGLAANPDHHHHQPHQWRGQLGAGRLFFWQAAVAAHSGFWLGLGVFYPHDDARSVYLPQGLRARLSRG